MVSEVYKEFTRKEGGDGGLQQEEQALIAPTCPHTENSAHNQTEEEAVDCEGSDEVSSIPQNNEGGFAAFEDEAAASHPPVHGGEEVNFEENDVKKGEMQSALECSPAYQGLSEEAMQQAVSQATKQEDSSSSVEAAPEGLPDLISSLPLRQYLDTLILPTLIDALHSICRDRPSNPIKVLAYRLLADDAAKLDAAKERDPQAGKASANSNYVMDV